LAPAAVTRIRHVLQTSEKKSEKENRKEKRNEMKVPTISEKLNAFAAEDFGNIF